MEVWKPWVSGKLMQSGCIFCSGEPKTWAICLKMWGEKVLTNKNLPKKTVILKNYLKQNIPQRKHSPQTFKKVFPKNIPQRKIWFHWLGFSNSICCLGFQFLHHIFRILCHQQETLAIHHLQNTLFFQNGSCFCCDCFFQVWFLLPFFERWKFQSPSDFSTNHLTLEDFWKKTSPLRIDIIPIIPLVLGPATWLPWSLYLPPPWRPRAVRELALDDMQRPGKRSATATASNGKQGQPWGPSWMIPGNQINLPHPRMTHMDWAPPGNYITYPSLGKRKFIFPNCLWMGYVSSQEGNDFHSIYFL